ncbi:hypothetical protein [Aquitalea sp. USM4]|uniref:hypothetical protein n=1 Tax=Aquitalea sp. USM4 TaxID=1590041 RepID=UPI00103F5A54|nr:hypothetical protein [Aquitalea sp. USM4]QBJ79466.1 hypothetical protein DKK66_16165 [Aquitalea sp. USM4]
MSQSNGEQTITAGSWTNIGTGPLTIQLLTLSGSATVIVSDTQPASGAVGSVLSQVRPIIQVNTAQAVWVQAAASFDNPSGSIAIDVMLGTPLVAISNLTSGIAQVSSRDPSGNANGIAGNPFYSVNVETGTAWNYVASSGGISTASSVVLAAADINGRCSYLRKLQLINTGSTATEVYVANGNSAIWRCKLPANMNTPAILSFDDGELISTANTALNFYVVTAGAAVYVNAQGFMK